MQTKHHIQHSSPNEQASIPCFKKLSAPEVSEMTTALARKLPCRTSPKCRIPATGIAGSQEILCNQSSNEGESSEPKSSPRKSNPSAFWNRLFPTQGLNALEGLAKHQPKFLPRKK